MPLGRRETGGRLQFNPAKRELTLKVVYYGPALSGKTTNLRALYQAAEGNCRGRLMTLDTADDRTLFFDLLPLNVRTQSGVRVKVKLFTVPGQVMHNSTRRIVLSGADAVAYIADAQPGARQANFDYWRNLGDNLRANAIHVEELPVVIQFNKCDLADQAMSDEIGEIHRTAREPVHLAVAIRQEGVVSTFLDLARLTYERLDAQHHLTSRLGMNQEEFLLELSRSLTDIPYVPAPPLQAVAAGTGS